MKRHTSSMPTHAISFSASLCCASLVGLSKILELNPLYTKISGACALILATEGLYELYQENRLFKIIKPFQNYYFNFWSVANTATSAPEHNQTQIEFKQLI